MEGRTKGSGGAWVYREHTVYITTTWIWRTTSGEVTDTTPIIPRTDQASSLMTCFEAQGITFYFLKSRQSIPLWEHKNWSWTQSSSWRKKGQSPFAGESKGMIFHPGPGGGDLKLSETLESSWLAVFGWKLAWKYPVTQHLDNFWLLFQKISEVCSGGKKRRLEPVKSHWSLRFQNRNEEILAWKCSTSKCSTWSLVTVSMQRCAKVPSSNQQLVTFGNFKHSLINSPFWGSPYQCPIVARCPRAAAGTPGASTRRRWSSAARRAPTAQPPASATWPCGCTRPDTEPGTVVPRPKDEQGNKDKLNNDEPKDHGRDHIGLDQLGPTTKQKKYISIGILRGKSWGKTPKTKAPQKNNAFKDAKFFSILISSWKIGAFPFQNQSKGFFSWPTYPPTCRATGKGGGQPPRKGINWSPKK